MICYMKGSKIDPMCTAELLTKLQLFLITNCRRETVFSYFNYKSSFDIFKYHLYLRKCVLTRYQTYILIKRVKVVSTDTIIVF